MISPPVTIVGAGPLGLILAKALVRRGQLVRVLEAGSGPPRPPDYHAEVADGNRHAPLGLANARALGGSSWWWGGRCVPLDPIDFEDRPHIPDSGWPINADDLAPFQAEASHWLGLPNLDYGACARQEAVCTDSLELWMNDPIVRDSNLPEGTVRQGVLVTGLIASAAGDRIIQLQTNVGTVELEGPLVLAAGGVQTTRLLLALRGNNPGGPLGHFYMGHVSGRIADIQFDDPRQASTFGYLPVAGGMSRRRFTLPVTTQLARQLPNGCAYPANPLLGEAGHGRGALSMLFLAMSAPFIGKRLVSAAIRKSQMRGRPDWAAHWRNILLDLPATLAIGLGIVRQMLIEKRRKPVLFCWSKDGRYPLHYHLEHLPNQQSTIQLADHLDPMGLPAIDIDLQYSDDDISNVLAWHEALDRGLQDAKIGHLIYTEAAESGLRDLVDRQMNDGFHQLGTTRMGHTPDDGVVDRDCKVFGIDNLHLAATSVFRTSGQANPTFSGAVLAVRLADHLARQTAHRQVTSSGPAA
jgi:hypothetical protein